MNDNFKTITCKNCGSLNCIEDNHDTGEFLIFCPDCGYYHCKSFARNPDGKFKLKDESLPESVDNIIVLDDIVENPIGAWFVIFKGGAFDFGPFEHEEEISQWAETIKQEKNFLSSATVSKLVNGEIVKIEHIQEEINNNIIEKENENDGNNN